MSQDSSTEPELVLLDACFSLRCDGDASFLVAPLAVVVRSATKRLSLLLGCWLLSFCESYDDVQDRVLFLVVCW